jgi:hypothetical protein
MTEQAAAQVQQQGQATPGADAAGVQQSIPISTPQQTSPAPPGKVEIPESQPQQTPQSPLVQLDAEIGERLKALGLPPDINGVQVLINSTEALMAEAVKIEQAERGEQVKTQRDEAKERMRAKVLAPTKTALKKLKLSESQEEALSDAIWGAIDEGIGIATAVNDYQVEDKLTRREQQYAHLRKTFAKPENAAFSARADEIVQYAAANRITVDAALDLIRQFAPTGKQPGQEDLYDEGYEAPPRQNPRARTHVEAPEPSAVPTRSNSSSKYAGWEKALDAAEKQGNIAELKRLHNSTFKR